MNKEEILKMSRNENIGKQDERELQIFADASKLAVAAGAVLAVIFVFMSRIFDEPLLGLSAWVLIFTMYGSRHLYSYIKLKGKFKLIQSIIAITFALVCMVGVILILGAK